MKLNRIKKIAKSAAAALTVSVLVVTGASAVFAGGTYVECEKEALASVIEDVAAMWDTEMADYESAKQGSSADMTLKVEEAGRSLLSILTAMDFSWLDTVSLTMDATIAEGMEAVDAALLVNDSGIMSMKMILDMVGMMEYIQIPELTESYLVAALTMTDETGAEITDESLNLSMNLLSDMSEYMPDGATMATLLDRYGNIIIDSFQEGPSVAETVSVGGIAEDCTVYEGQMYEDAANEMLEQILTTAKEDVELKALIEKWAAADPESGDLYANFQASIDESLTEMQADVEADTESSSEYVSSKIWVNAEGEIVGREVAFTDGMESDLAFTWKHPEQENTSALLLEMYSDGSAITVAGTGETTDGIKSGAYVFAIDYQTMANIVMENYDVAAAEAGAVNATYTISFPETEGEGDAAAANPLSAFGIVVDVASNAETGESAVVLTLTSGGAPLASLTMTGGYGEGAGIPDISSIGTMYDAADENAMAAYGEEISFDTVLENARAAGVPENLVTMIDQMIQSALSAETVEGNL